MDLSIRRIIYLIFIIVFLALTPIIILYASGYRYNFKLAQLQKTGILIIETEPKGADVFINQNKAARKTPIELKNLLPDDYLVKIEKMGYFSWEKKLKVQSNLTTFANNILLIKKSLPALETAGEIFWLEPIFGGNRYLYNFIDGEESAINIYDRDSLMTKTLFSTKPNYMINFIEWSGNNKKMLVKYNYNNYAFIDIEMEQAKELPKLKAFSFEKLHWDRLNAGLLYGLSKNSLYQINAETEQTKAVMAKYIEDFYILGQNVYYITKTSDGSYLNHQTLENDESIKALRLPNFSNYEFRPAPNNLLLVFDKKNNEMFLANRDVFEKSETEQKSIMQAVKAKEVNWTGDFKDAIFYNDFEIYNYSAENNDLHLVTRVGQEIKNAVRLQNSDYIIYIADNTLNIIELGFEIVNNNFKLAELNLLGRNLFIDKKGKLIYFTGRLGGQSGIFELEIN